MNHHKSESNGISRRKALKAIGTAGISAGALTGIGAAHDTDHTLTIYLHRTHSNHRDHYDENDYVDYFHVVYTALNRVWKHQDLWLDSVNWEIVEGDYIDNKKPDNEDSETIYEWASEETKADGKFNTNQNYDDAHILLFDGAFDLEIDWRSYPPKPKSIGYGASEGTVGSSVNPAAFCWVNVGALEHHDDHRAAMAMVLHELGHILIDGDFVNVCDGTEHAIGGFTLNSNDLVDMVYPMSTSYVYNIDSNLNNDIWTFDLQLPGTGTKPDEFWNGMPNNEYHIDSDCDHRLYYASERDLSPECGDCSEEAIALTLWYYFERNNHTSRERPRSPYRR